MPVKCLPHGTVPCLDAAREEEVVDQHQREAVGCYLFLLLQEIRRCDRFRERGLVWRGRVINW
jgi:hypothetical protein